MATENKKAVDKINGFFVFSKLMGYKLEVASTPLIKSPYFTLN
tara:strand:- start:187 stop:315 length:129 start_codon:yes stop_codon:yes gene_type:complete